MCFDPINACGGRLEGVWKKLPEGLGRDAVSSSSSSLPVVSLRTSNFHPSHK